MLKTKPTFARKNMEAAASTTPTQITMMNGIPEIQRQFHVNLYQILHLNREPIYKYTVCPRSSDPFYVVSYYIKQVITSWTYSIFVFSLSLFFLFLNKIIFSLLLFFFLVIFFKQQNYLCSETIDLTGSEKSIIPRSFASTTAGKPEILSAENSLRFPEESTNNVVEKSANFVAESGSSTPLPPNKINTESIENSINVEGAGIQLLSCCFLSLSHTLSPSFSLSLSHTHTLSISFYLCLSSLFIYLSICFFVFLFLFLPVHFCNCLHHLVSSLCIYFSYLSLYLSTQL